MIISLDKFKNKGSGDGGNGKYVVTDGTKFTLSEWEYVPEELVFSQVTKFDNMFQTALDLKHGLYLDDWSKVTNCTQMYCNCSSLESVPDMNTSNCTSFFSMFRRTGIVHAPNIDVSNASSVGFMFDSCHNLQHIGELNTINVTQPDAFNQLCSICPNLTTVEGIDFSGIVDTVYCQITDSYNGPIMFYQNDSLTNITVNGAINFSWNNDYGFNALPNLTAESIESILTAMSKCINPEEPKIMRFNYKMQDDTLKPLIEDCQSKGWTIEGIRFNGEEDDNTPGVFFDDGDAPISIPYTGTSETQQMIIPFNWYGVPNGAPSLGENYWIGKGIRRNGIDFNIEVIEGDIEGFTHSVHIAVGSNIYNETINDYVEFIYVVDNDGNTMEYRKPINLEANPDSQLGFINVSSNYDGNLLPSSVDRFEILFNVHNAEYHDAYPISDNLENFNVSFEPTDIEGYTHVAYITYDNKSHAVGSFEFKFSNGYYEEDRVFFVEAAPYAESGPFYDTVDTAAFGDPSNAIPVSFTKFAAAEPSNEQWYELTGVIRGCPTLEKGILILDDPTGEYTVDEPQLNSWPLEGSPGIFIFGITTELIGDNDQSFGSVFPGDGSTITIRTLRHTTDTDYMLNAGDWHLPAGSIIGGKFNSPCAVYVGTSEPESESE